MKKIILVFTMFICLGINIIPQTNNFQKKNVEIIHNTISKSFLNEIGNTFEILLYNNNDIDTVNLTLYKVEGVDTNNKFYTITNKEYINNQSIIYNRLIFKEINKNTEIVAILNIGNKDWYEFNDFSRIIVKSQNHQQLFLTTYDYKANVLFCGKTLKFNLN